MDRLKIEADRLLALSIAPNSHKAYSTAWQAYEKMCTEINAPATLPISRSQLIAFIAHLSISGKQASTIVVYISGLAFLHKSKGFPDPSDCFIIRKMLEGCRRDRPRVPDFRHPITHDILKHAVSGCQAVCYTVYDACMFRAAMVLAFYGFLRVGEFTAPSVNKFSGRVLQLSDIAFKTTVSQGQQTKQVHVTIRYSKTDQRGRSTTLVLSQTKFKATCPFRTLEEYVSLRTPGVGQLFWHFDKSPLTRYQFSAIVKKSLLSQNISSEGITSHSFRIGACTHFAMAGVSDEDLKKMGRWASSVYQRYIRIPSMPV